MLTSLKNSYSFHRHMCVRFRELTLEISEASLHWVALHPLVPDASAPSGLPIMAPAIGPHRTIMQTSGDVAAGRVCGSERCDHAAACASYRYQAVCRYVVEIQGVVVSADVDLVTRDGVDSALREVGPRQLEGLHAGCGMFDRGLVR